MALSTNITQCAPEAT